MHRLLFIAHTSEFGGPNARLLSLLRRIPSQYSTTVIAPGNGKLFDLLEEIKIQSKNPGEKGLRRKAIPWLYQIIKDEGINLVYGNNFSGGTRNALIAAKAARRPYIWHINEMVHAEGFPQFKRTFFLRFADVLIADSKACQKTVQDHVPNKPIHQINNGIEISGYYQDRDRWKQYVRDIFGFWGENIILTSAGAITPRKGQEFGIEAAIKIVEEFPRARFLFLGSTDADSWYTQSLQKKVNDNNCGGKILFTGFRDDFQKIIAGSDIFFHTAVRDPQPIAVLEAMAARLAVVAFGVDGVKEEVVDRQTGFLIQPKDIHSLREGMKRCILDSELRQRLGENGRRRVEDEFSADETAKRIIDVIENTIKDGHKSMTMGLGRRND